MRYINRLFTFTYFTYFNVLKNLQRFYIYDVAVLAKMFAEESENVSCYNTKCRIDAEIFFKVTGP